MCLHLLALDKTFVVPDARTEFGFLSAQNCCRVLVCASSCIPRCSQYGSRRYITAPPKGCCLTGRAIGDIDAGIYHYSLPAYPADAAATSVVTAVSVNQTTRNHAELMGMVDAKCSTPNDGTDGMRNFINGLLEYVLTIQTRMLSTNRVTTGIAIMC